MSTVRSGIGRTLVDLDRAISSGLLLNLDSRPAALLMRGFTGLGSPKVFIPVGIAFAGWSWWMNDRRAALVLLAVTVLTREVIRYAKRFLRRTRPDFFSEVRRLTSSSFPSGHALAGVAIYGTVAHVVSLLEPTIQPAAVAVTPVVVLMIGVSRVALGAHWMTDVLAGFALGAVILVMGSVALGT